MKKMLGFLGKSALSSLRSGLKEMQTMIDEFDMEKTKEELLKKGSELKAEMKVFAERVRNYVDKFEVDIPYDKDKETFTYTFGENEIEVEVQSNDGMKSQSTVVTIPEDVDTDKIIQTYDNEKKILTLSIAKVF